MYIELLRENFKDHLPVSVNVLLYYSAYLFFLQRNISKPASWIHRAFFSRQNEINTRKENAFGMNIFDQSLL